MNDSSHHSYHAHLHSTTYAGGGDMKTPDEVKKELRLCKDMSFCEWCGMNDQCEKNEYVIECIEQLETRLAQVERERDAAVNDVHSLCATNYFSGDYCEYCKYREPDGQCFHDCTPYSSKWGWEWRGVCAENSKEE